ncbi:MAG: hypothetical protein J1F23_06005 [Oscillospiraceae bacterium]|nr:hypothetical protein [Oscillospiraceae bacterium]
MAVSFVARKCTQCAGKLKYIKEKKLWQCLYCGAEIEREETYDGLFTIKNVVRQSLLDTAYRRLDSAEKNIIECEKIDSRYIGTLIAKIAFEMISVITPGACDPNNTKNIFSQLKKNYEQLREVSTTVSDEEEALYDFFEESDIFATLLLVYDSLNDVARRDFVANLIDAEDIYSKAANTNLLTYSIKNSKFEMADKVLNNTNNLDNLSALVEVLNKYPDNDNKANNIDKLLGTGEIKGENKTIIENYLSSSDDSVKTKSCVLVSALTSGMKLGTELIIHTILSKADAEQVQAVLPCMCKSRLNDEDTLRILSFAYECGNYNIATIVLNCLKESEQYVLLPAKYIISMLSQTTYSAEEKVALLKLSFEFKIENKSFESIVSNYLCFNSDDIQTRKAILDCLFDRATTFPTSLVETYVLKCSSDGERKPDIIKQMFDKGLNTTFFNDLLSRYMSATTDSQEVKIAVIDTLTMIGLKIDPSAFADYICESNDEVQNKINFIGKMIRNGAQIRSDTANLYLEKTKPEDFSSELFATIFTPVSSFSAKAIENYILRFREREAVKAQNAKTILDLSPNVVTNITCQISHLNNSISCNLLQAYLLQTEDSQTVAFDIVNNLINGQRIKINEEMRVSGTPMKLKKYVVANKSNLSEATNAICEKYKVYSMIF